MMSSLKILMTNGTVLTYRKGHLIVLKNHDVFINNGIIEKIGQDLRGILGSHVDETRIIDCSGKILAPGFVSTHNHLWQTQLKGRHGDDTQMDFIVKGNLQATNYTPYDVYIGVLTACLECISAGITTVVDQAHMAVSPAHSLAALAAIKDSGIRAYFCYTPPLTLSLAPLSKLDKEGNGLVQRQAETFPAWSVSQFEKLKTLPLPTRIALGFGGDFVLSKSPIDIGAFVERHLSSVKLLTAHWGRHPLFPTSKDYLNSPSILSKTSKSTQYPQILLAHCCSPIDHETDDVFGNTSGKISHSSVPFAEPGLGLGEPLVMQLLNKDSARISLGVGCHSIIASEMFTPMRVATTLARLHQSRKCLEAGKAFSQANTTMNDIFSLATWKGAAALGRSDFGILEEGAKADIVVYSSTSSQMCIAADEDPIAAIVNFATAGDIELVLVDGHIRKENTEISSTKICSSTSLTDTPFPIDGWAKGIDNMKEEQLWWEYFQGNLKEGTGMVDWPEVRKALIVSKDRINERVRLYPEDRLKQEIMAAMGIVLADSAYQTME